VHTFSETLRSMLRNVQPVAGDVARWACGMASKAWIPKLGVVPDLGGQDAPQRPSKRRCLAADRFPRIPISETFVVKKKRKASSWFLLFAR
jgi:hypothetical protein